MNRRTLLAACPLALLVGCNSLVSINPDARGFADALVDGLAQYAPPDVGAKMQAAYVALKAGGNWKTSLKALAELADEVLKTGLVPEPTSSYARTVIGGVHLLLGFAAAPVNGRSVTIEEARGAAELLRGVR